MKAIANLTDLSTVSNVSPAALLEYRGRALAIFDTVMRLGGLEWQTEAGIVTVIWCGCGEYSVLVNGALTEKGTIGCTIEKVKMLAAGLE